MAEADPHVALEGDEVALDTVSEEQAPHRSLEDIAREHGWRPKDEYRGDDGDWRDAESFITFGLTRQRDLTRDIKHLRANTEAIVRTTAQITEDAVRKARDDERSQWQQRHRQAVEEGDVAGAEQAVGKIAELAASPAAKSGPPPEVASFVRENAWMENDPAAAAVAATEADRIAKAGGSVTEQLAAARTAVHKRFPEYAPASPKPPAAVSSPSSRAAPTGGRKKGFSDLPRDAQEVARQLVNRGFVSSTEAYADQYFAGKGA
jgi:hypothetical protein